MLKVFSVPILKDNYVHVIGDMEKKLCLIVDPGSAEPVLEFLNTTGLRPIAILLTHHHWDHIGGVQELQNYYRKKEMAVVVYAPAREKKDIPFADKYLLSGDELKVLGLEFKVMELPGHTLGHIAYYEANESWLFSGDVLFSLGCGRLFEGTMEQHYQSLQTLKALPAETWVYATHEYTLINTQFCESQDSDNAALKVFGEKVRAARTAGKPTVPFRLQQELELNPFLKAKDLTTFRNLREARDHF